MSKPPIVYAETSLFLAYFGGEAGRADLCKELLAEGQRGDKRIYTSAFTLVEVLRGKAGKQISTERARRQPARRRKCSTPWKKSPFEDRPRRCGDRDGRSAFVPPSTSRAELLTNRLRQTLVARVHALPVPRLWRRRRRAASDS